MSDDSYEAFRDRAVAKASWLIVAEQKALGRDIDRASVVSDLWSWLLETGRGGKTGDDRLRILLSPDNRKFRTAVQDLAQVARRAFDVKELPADLMPADDEKWRDNDWRLLPIVTATPSRAWPGPLERAIEALPSPDRDILQMTAEGLDATEIGTVLELQPATVRQRRKRAIDRLRQQAEAA